MRKLDLASWFDGYRCCRRCRKAATGIIRGTTNENLGYYCDGCAEFRINKAKKMRAAWLAKR
jgi:hypothetical protein